MKHFLFYCDPRGHKHAQDGENCWADDLEKQWVEGRLLGATRATHFMWFYIRKDRIYQDAYAFMFVKNIENVLNVTLCHPEQVVYDIRFSVFIQKENLSKSDQGKFVLWFCTFSQINPN